MISQVCVYVCVYICVSVHVCVRECACAYVRVYVCVHGLLCIRVCVHVCVRSPSSVFVLIHVQTYNIESTRHIFRSQALLGSSHVHHPYTYMHTLIHSTLTNNVHVHSTNFIPNWTLNIQYHTFFILSHKYNSC